MGINQLFVRQIRMKFATYLFLVASASAAPQFGGLKKLVSSLSGDEAPGEVNGDYEQVPYETIQMFEGYEERRYPSVNFACTELEYEMDAEESDNTEWSLERVMKWISNKSSWKKKPESKMFMKLFRYHDTFTSYMQRLQQLQHELRLTKAFITLSFILISVVVVSFLGYCWAFVPAYLRMFIS